MYLFAVIMVANLVKGDPIKAFLISVVGLAFIQLIVLFLQRLMRREEDRESWVTIALRLIFLGLLSVFAPVVAYMIGGFLSLGHAPIIGDLSVVKWAVTWVERAISWLMSPVLLLIGAVTSKSSGSSRFGFKFASH